KVPSTGFRELDAVTGGLLPTLIIIGAQPGVGKSAFLAGLIRHLAGSGVPLGLFSLEDRASWLVWRLLACETGLSPSVLGSKGLSQEARVGAQQGFEEIRRYGTAVWLDDRPMLSPKDVSATATAMMEKRGARAILVDHLGELRFGNRHGDRYDLDVADGLSLLRNLANAHQVPVVCATQLRRECNEPPQLTDFANAAAIERMARIAIALTRKPGEQEATAWILKNTNGEAGVSCRIPFALHAAIARGDRGALRAVP